MLFILLIWTLVASYILLKRHFEHWKNLNIPGPEPTLLFGNTADHIFNRKNLGEIFKDVYNDYQDYPFVGVYRFGTPCILVRDPDFVKEVTVKSFHHFQDNDVNVDKDNNPLLGRNPFVLKTSEWKHVRTLLTPGYSSGKMKYAALIIEKVCKRMLKYIEKQIDTRGNSFEGRDLCSKFTLDNVASYGIGVEGGAFEEEPSEFKYIAENVFLTGFGTLVLLFSMVFTYYIKLFKLRLTDPEVVNKIKEVTKSTIEYRRQKNIICNDFLQYMMELEQKHDSFNLEDISAHIAGMLLDGYDTTSNVMGYLLYELACNKTKQVNLRENIKDVLARQDNKFSYEAVQEMEYLHACIMETLRKHPIFLVVPKVCTEKYKYSTPETSEFKKMSVTIEPGQTVLLPVKALHMDPKYFPNPDKFEPERFLPENKDSFPKYVFMPFGEGQRSCLGQRFGLIQLKLGVAHIIKDYKVIPNSKTEIPLRIAPWHFITSPPNGFWFDLHKIN